jgi:hypothetical protein
MLKRLVGPTRQAVNRSRGTHCVDATPPAASALHPLGRPRSALLLARGSGSTAAAAAIKVTLLPTEVGKKVLKKSRHGIQVVLLTSVKDAKTGKVTTLPPHRLTLER